jgi:hypothetical protein
MIFSCVVTFKRKKKKNSGFIATTLYSINEGTFPINMDMDIYHKNY